MTPLIDNERGSIWHDRVQLRRRRPPYAEGGREKTGAKQRVLIGMRACVLCNILKHLLRAVIGTELDSIHQRQCVHTVDMSVDKARQHRSTLELDDLGLRTNLRIGSLTLA